LLTVPGNAKAIQVHPAKIVLSIGVFLFSGFVVSGYGLHYILADTVPPTPEQIATAPRILRSRQLPVF